LGVAGKTGAAFENHLSYLPHSGSAFRGLAGELTGSEWSAREGRRAAQRAAKASVSRLTRASS
jgi:hypothetical protein